MEVSLCTGNSHLLLLRDKYREEVPGGGAGRSAETPGVEGLYSEQASPSLRSNLLLLDECKSVQ